MSYIDPYLEATVWIRADEQLTMVSNLLEDLEENITKYGSTEQINRVHRKIWGLQSRTFNIRDLIEEFARYSSHNPTKESK
jgi:hypothetical protein